jgi:hypothetical protein
MLAAFHLDIMGRGFIVLRLHSYKAHMEVECI